MNLNLIESSNRPQRADRLRYVRNPLKKVPAPYFHEARMRMTNATHTMTPFTDRTLTFVDAS